MFPTQHDGIFKVCQHVFERRKLQSMQPYKNHNWLMHVLKMWILKLGTDKPSLDAHSQIVTMEVNTVYLCIKTTCKQYKKWSQHQILG